MIWQSRLTRNFARCQALRAARARGVKAPPELEGGREAGRRLEGDLGALRQRDGGKAGERREIVGRERAAARVGQAEQEIQQGRVGHRGEVDGSGLHRAPPREGGRSAGASAW